MKHASKLMNVLIAPHVTEKTSLAMQNAQPVHVPRAPRCHQDRHQAGRRAHVRRQGRGRAGGERARQDAPLRQAPGRTQDWKKAYVRLAAGPDDRLRSQAQGLKVVTHGTHQDASRLRRARASVVKLDRSHLYKGGPYAPLTVHQNKTGARNNFGRITTRHVGRRLAPEVPHHRLPARQGRHQGRGRAHRVRPEPHRAHRADQVCRRRAPLHPRAQGHEAGRRSALGRRCADQARQRHAAAPHPGRLDRAQHRAEARQGRPDGAQRRQLRPVHRARRHLRAPAPEVGRDPQGARRLPRHDRRSRQRRAQPAHVRQGRRQALARHPPDGARPGDEPGRSPARWWRRQVRPGQSASGVAVGPERPRA